MKDKTFDVALHDYVIHTHVWSQSTSSCQSVLYLALL